MAIGNFSEKPPVEQPRPVRQPERVTRPERGGFKLELPWLRPERKSEPKPAEQPAPNPTTPAVSSAAPSWQAERAAEIDRILADGLNDIFLKLNPDDQRRFKAKGEETVAKINVLLSKAKVKVSKIISLIRDWLKIVPGINKFFLEQEVKIKADKILKLKDKF